MLNYIIPTGVLYCSIVFSAYVNIQLVWSFVVIIIVIIIIATSGKKMAFHGRGWCEMASPTKYTFYSGNITVDAINSLASGKFELKICNFQTDFNDW